MDPVKSIAGIVVALAVGGGVAWAGSQGSAQVGGLPLFALCAAGAYAIQWLAFIPAYLKQTEHYFDLTGSLTYLSLVLGSWLLGPAPSGRSLLIGGLVAVWAVRLGSFLFRRVRQDGSDGRFDPIKPNFFWFLMTWTLQGLWVFLTLSCGLAAMTAEQPVALGWIGALGAGIWLVGFGIEVVADQQKRRFRQEADAHQKFIQTGLWAWSRHPNYFGEILLWVGIAVIALPALSGLQFVTLISPVFVYLLLTKISGVPMLESRAKKRWGDDPAYRSYVESTPVVMLRPPSAQ